MGTDAIVTGMSSSLHRNWTVVLIIMFVLSMGGGVFGLNMKDSEEAAIFLIIASIIVSIQTLVCVMCAGIAGFFVVLAVAPVLLLFIVLRGK